MGSVVEVGGVVESDLVVGLIRLAVVDTQDVFGSRFQLVATGEWAGPVELESVFVELQAVVGELVAVADGDVRIFYVPEKQPAPAAKEKQAEAATVASKAAEPKTTKKAVQAAANDEALA